MTIKTNQYFTVEFDGTTVALFYDDKTYDIYYMRPGYPMMYAFGLPKEKHNIGDVLEIAEANIPQYEYMFN